MVLPGYTIRLLAGAPATWTPISPWLAAFSIFFSLSGDRQALQRRSRTEVRGFPHGEEWDFKYLELTARSLFGYFGLTTTVHLRAAPTGSARLLERHFKDMWHEEYPAGSSSIS
jgi:hypothetical protein